ncbi:Pentatricopeptide repeat-containing protein, mitochondrial [Glycine soja]|uniref:Pentatricopeptide repeat-containing protein, mitochondrial n=1 Tax=Glycine soja TaxID=3848 RepID=A0A445GST9_GLYSO|nr:Pentatricopeptide repeat-containing protein, mitochondrial [Glycine soja]
MINMCVCQYRRRICQPSFRFLRHFKATISTDPEKGLVKNANGVLVSNKGTPLIPKNLSLKPRSSDDALHKRNAEITIHGRPGKLEEAKKLFDEMPQRDDVSYNSMIAFYLKNRDILGAEAVFKAMPHRNIVAESAMIDGDVKVGRLDDVRNVFDSMTHSNAFSWTSLISGYFSCGRIEEALHLFDQVPERNVVFWTSVVLGFACNALMDHARRFFYLMPEKNIIAWTAMVKAYLDNGYFSEAYKLFREMPERNVRSWNIMISGCLRVNRMNEAIGLFESMPDRNHVSWTAMVSDMAAWTAMITACVDDGLMDEVCELFNLMPQKNVGSWNTMIDGYARNDDVGEALRLFVLMLRLVFELLKSKDVVSWTAMIVAYSNHGHGHHALQVFTRMLVSGIKPDEITFVGLLSACSHVGLVNQGRRLFVSIKGTYNLNPKAEHYSCLVDILGRAGLVDEAMDVVSTIPPSERDEAVLVALLGVCRLHGDVAIANSIGENLLEIEPSSSGGYVLLANTYATEGQWDEFAKGKE